MKEAINKLKKSISFLFREELDIAHRTMNLVLCVAIIAMLPTIITTALLDTGYLGTISVIFILIVLGVFLKVINRFPTSKIPIIISVISINLVAFPVMYFNCGGRKTGMIVWMALGAIFSVVLLEGIWILLAYLSEIASLALCMWKEYKNPEIVKLLTSDKAEIFDIIISFSVIVAVMGGVFMYQRGLYKKEHKILKLREAELEKLNLELNKASQAKTSFLANMSHEIRTPINAVLGMDEMILRDCRDDAILEYAEEINSAGKQLLSIINDILDFSKIESGKFEICEEEYNLFDVITDCYNLVIARAEAKSLTLMVKNDPEMPEKLKGDSMRIRQILTNLLSNAIKYTEEGHIELNFSSRPLDENHIFFEASVKDTGIGISKEDIERLFGAFNRIDEKEHRNIEGTGLGLAITKQLTELMGGTIGVESTKGVGSEFYISIPQEIASQKKTGLFDVGMAVRRESKKRYRSSFTAPHAKILVVDDVKVNLNVVKLLLRDTEMSVETADSGKEALNLLLDTKYDCVLMDHMMPEMDGIQTLKEARRMCEINISTPMIALTANAIHGADEMYLKEGFCEYITKPIKTEDLEAALIRRLPSEKVNVRFS